MTYGVRANMPIPVANTDVQIRRADAALGAAWDAFVSRHAGASFYHRFAWKRINEEVLGHETFFLAALQGETVVGIFPLVLIRSRLFGRILCSMPFVNYGGPCADDATTAQALLREAQSIADAHKVDYLEIRSLQPPVGPLETSLHKVSMTIQLDPDPEKLFAAFDGKHRKNVRRAYKNGFEVRVSGAEQLDAFFSVMAQSWREHGTPILSKSAFGAVANTFGDNARIFVAYQGELAVAAALTGYHNGVVEGLWAGSLASHRAQQPNYVLYWEMIKHACETKNTVFHLGRSTAGSGAETFKTKWNADAKQLYWQYYLPGGGALPQLNVDNPKYRLAINVWRRLPVKLTTMIGPLLAHSIP